MPHRAFFFSFVAAPSHGAFYSFFCSCMNAKTRSTPNQPNGQKWLPHTDDRLWHDLDGIMEAMDDTARNLVTQSGRRRNKNILMI